MDKAAADRAAQVLADAWKRHAQIDALPKDAQPANEDDCYAIQFALDRQLGFATVGWKLGHSSPAALPRTGLAHPPAGRLYRHTVKNSPAAAFGRRDLHAPRLETEFCYRLKTALPPRAAPYAESEVLAAVEGLFLAIEIADSRFKDSKAAGILSVVADNMGTGGFILGPAVADWRSRDLRAVPVTLMVDGKTVAEQAAREERCDPLWVLIDAANHLSRRGIGLGAGHLVSTGSHTTPLPVAMGCDVVARFGGLGDVKVRLDA